MNKYANKLIPRFFETVNCKKNNAPKYYNLKIKFPHFFKFQATRILQGDQFWSSTVMLKGQRLSPHGKWRPFSSTSLVYQGKCRKVLYTTKGVSSFDHLWCFSYFFFFFLSCLFLLYINTNIAEYILKSV